MKTSNKLFIALSLLIYFTTMSMAQVTHIFDPETVNSSEIIPKIRIEDNQLFAITPNGVYSQELDEFGNLVGESLSLSELFINIEFDINDFVINGNTIFVASTDPDESINLILKSEDKGKTWTNLDEWKDLVGSVSYQDISIKRGNLQNLNEIYILIGDQIYFTSDFGETWNRKGACQKEFKKVSPLDSKICVSCYETFFAVLDNKEFCISNDYGVSWNNIGSYIETIDVAFHYSDVNKIVLNGNPISVSKDCGKTWEVTKNWGYENKDLYLIQTEFDTRGSDRLYATRSNILLYSDDFGANWNELCVVGESSSDYIANFVQQNDKIYTITKEYKVYEVDLELLESSVEEVAIDNGKVSVSVVGNSLQINSKTPISMVEIYNISGVKLHSSEMLEGAVVDISALTKGTYVARLYASNGNSVSIKFNK